MRRGEQTVAGAVLRAAARVRTQAAVRSAAQAEIVLAGPAARGELRLTADEEVRARQMRHAPDFDLDKVLAKGRVWRPREPEWALSYSQDW